MLLVRYNSASCGRLSKVGILPDKLLKDKLNIVKEEMLKIEYGISPVRDAWSMFNISSLVRFPISAGIPPEIIKINDKFIFIAHLRSLCILYWYKICSKICLFVGNGGQVPKGMQKGAEFGMHTKMEENEHKVEDY